MQLAAVSPPFDYLARYRAETGIGGDPIGKSWHVERSFPSGIYLAGGGDPPLPTISFFLLLFSSNSACVPSMARVFPANSFFSQTFFNVWVISFEKRVQEWIRIDGMDGREGTAGEGEDEIERIGKSRAGSRVIEEETPPRHPHSDEREAILPLVQGKIG